MFKKSKFTLILENETFWILKYMYIHVGQNLTYILSGGDPHFGWKQDFQSLKWLLSRKRFIFSSTFFSVFVLSNSPEELQIFWNPYMLWLWFGPRFILKGRGVQRASANKEIEFQALNTLRLHLNNLSVITISFLATACFARRGLYHHLVLLI